MHVARSSRLRTHAVVGAAAVVSFVAVAYRSEGLEWVEAAGATLAFVAPCVLLAALAWHWLVRRDGLAYGAAVHLLAAAAFAAAWTALFAGAVHALRPGEADEYLRGPAVWQALWGGVIYGALFGAARLWKRGEEQRAAVAQAELVALRAQLSPHFLFNTLHSLTQLAREDPGAVEAALEEFGALLRHVLGTTARAADTTLEDELGFVRRCLALERRRLGPRLAVVEAIEPDALECAVPPLLLQPLVENAVRHGLARRRRGGTLALRAWLDADVLCIEISDDGAGAVAIDPSGSTGLGLRATQRLLQAFAPGRSSLAIDTAPDRGCRVRLRLPARLPRSEPVAC